MAQEEEEQTATPPAAPAPAAPDSPGANFDTGYRPSPSVSARVQREFLNQLRWSSGAEVRDNLAAAFRERSPTDIWLELVEKDGLKANNVADALTAYWVLNWITANGFYTAKVNNAPIQRQLRSAFYADRNFRTLSDMKKQELAEGYILNFLLEHAALNNAVEARDVPTLNRLAAASVLRFQKDMGVNLLLLEPSEEGFRARRLGPVPQPEQQPAPEAGD
ncbi:MAG: hypothetical protein GX970_04420 [Phyllobacteriaceae bacterium]|nr:hypothetical protein [Phyllobacteriaceae bacterium]